MTRVVSYFDELYAPLFKIMLKSFLKYNSWFDDYISVYDWGISENTKRRVLDIYPKIEFLEVDKSYYDLREETLDKFYFGKNFQKFEIFKLEYEKIIVFDADLLFQGDVSELFSGYNDALYVDVNEPTEYEKVVPYPDTGIMVIPKKYLTLEYYQKCLAFMEKELVKDLSGDCTRVSNEWVFHYVFDGEMKPLDKRFQIADVNDNLKNRYVVGTPEYKPFISDHRYMQFVNQNLLPWDHKEEVTKLMKFIKLLKNEKLWQFTLNELENYETK